MKEFLEKLRQQVAENPPNYGDADSVLGLLYECSRRFTFAMALAIFSSARICQLKIN